ncbi:MAG TPA: hypothetical protein VHE81_14465 [Lacipirellulaceae bacterium]|nr:hypothetical protein [Lacipirellulaceae bacterium]
MLAKRWPRPPHLRNVGVSLVITASTFAGTPAVTAVVAFGLLSVVGAFALAKLADWTAPQNCHERGRPN